MSQLNLTDNTYNIKIAELKGTERDYRNLQDIANVPINKLIAKNPNLLIFPHSFNNNPDKIEDDNIIKMEGSFDNAEISTWNIMGYIGCGDTQLTINSRFQKGSEQDHFLHYMIQKVFLPSIVNLPHTTNIERVFDFLPLLFPYYLKKALSQGLFKTYQKYERNDSRVKGVIDVNRHIKLNIPFVGKVAYTSRESSYDNQITQLIRHTIEYIKTKPFGKSILTKTSEIQSFVKQIIDSTPTYSVRHRKIVINNNLKPLNHPYYSEYRPLQKLCMAILNHKKLCYGDGSKKVYGILFDGAWLWEEYLATILCKCGFTHAENKTGKNPIYIYEDNTVPRYPDFYKGKQKSQKDTNIVVDAKYKHIESLTKINREDLHQIITYLHILPAQNAYLIYPDDHNNEIVKPKTISGLQGKIGIIGVPIPQKEEHFDSFYTAMQKTEKDLLINHFLQ